MLLFDHVYVAEKDVCLLKRLVKKVDFFLVGRKEEQRSRKNWKKEAEQSRYKYSNKIN